MRKRSLDDLQEEMKDVVTGARVPPSRPMVDVTASNPFSDGNMALLKAIIQKRPQTVAELCTITGRAQPNVSRSLQILAKNGVIRMVRDRRTVRPEPVWLEAKVNFATGEYEMLTAVEG